MGDVLLTKSTDHTSKPTWIDERLIERFVAYHSGFKLRLVSALENQSVIRRLQNKSAQETRWHHGGECADDLPGASA